MVDMIRICHVEELALLPRWLKQIVSHHCSSSYSEPNKHPIEIVLRSNVQGFEVDMIVTCKSGSRTVRIGFELKTWSGIDKAASQAVERRALFHYFYIVVDLSVMSILGILKGRSWGEEVLRHGIGFVSASDNCIVIKSYSKANWVYSKSYAYTILSYLGEQYEGDT